MFYLWCFYCTSKSTKEHKKFQHFDIKVLQFCSRYPNNPNFDTVPSAQHDVHILQWSIKRRLPTKKQLNSIWGCLIFISSYFHTKPLSPHNLTIFKAELNRVHVESKNMQNLGGLNFCWILNTKFLPKFQVELCCFFVVSLIY